MGLIKSEREYQMTKEKILNFKESMKKQSLNHKLAKAALASQESFYLQMEEEVKEYENIKKGHIPNYFFEINNLGLLLIALRIKSGLTQIDLAKKLDVSQAQVSRDENNDYYGVGLPKIKQILKALDINLEIKIIK